MTEHRNRKHIERIELERLHDIMHAIAKYAALRLYLKVFTLP